MNIELELYRRAEEIEKLFKEFYRPSRFCNRLDESIEYTLFSGGKRLRPILTLASYRTLGGKDCKSVYLLALAIEILHNYTLIHDDLPCMDNDDFRRGKPTNHKVFGEATALLAGDALLSLSHEYLYEAITSAENKSLYLSAAKLITELTGPMGTIGGQAMEIESKGNDLKDNLLEIINGKTCKLISASILTGAIVSNADEKTLTSLAKYSQCLGYAFQLSDDLLDKAEKGRYDEKSIVNFYGEEYTRTLMECYIKNALNSLSELDCNTEFFEEIVKYCAKRQK